MTAVKSRIASEEDADEEEEHDALPVFSPSRPARAPGPLAVPGAAQLLIPPALLNGRGLALSSYSPHDTRLYGLSVAAREGMRRPGRHPQS